MNDRPAPPSAPLSPDRDDAGVVFPSSAIPTGNLQEVSRRMAEWEDKFDVLADTLPAMVFIHREGRLLYVNPITSVITGYPREELLESTFAVTHLVPEARRPEIQDKMREIHLGVSIPPFECPLITRDGREIPVWCTSRRMFHNNEAVTLSVATEVSRMQNTGIWRESIRRNLEEAVEMRTLELTIINEKLREEIEERRRAEEEIDRYRQHLEELVAERTRRLEETNIRLKNEIAEKQRAEDRTISSEIRYRTLFESANDTIFLLLDGQITDCNRQAERQFGMEKNTLLGATLEMLSAENQADGRADTARIGEWCQAAQCGTAQHFEWRHRRADGGEFDAEIHLHTVEILGCRLVQAIIRDITERKTQEKRQNALYRISTASSAALDLPELFPALQRIVGTLLNTRNFYIALLDAGNGFLHFPYFCDELDAPPCPRAARHGLTEYVMESGRPELLEKADIERLIREGRVERFGTVPESWLGIPLLHENRVVGALVVQSYFGDCRYNENDKELLVFVSQHIANAIVKKKAEDALRESERRFKETLDLLPTGVCEFDTNGRVTYANQAIYATFGYSADEFDEEPFFHRFLHPECSEECSENFRRLLHGEAGGSRKYKMLHKDGSTLHVILRSAPLYKYDRIAGIRSSLTDITERVNLEEHFLEIQKLESLGLLAGGVAHDFNNILGGILGYASLIKMQMSQEHPFYTYIDTIERGASRAAELTAQLLAFARGGKHDPKPVDLNHIIQEALKIIGRTIDKSIHIETCLAAELPPVEADAGQIQQVVINLCLNARDAMPQGGRLRLTTARVPAQQVEHAGHPDVPPGEYLHLVVTDTGIGMDEAVRLRIFEPFFTTKEKGKGTGLGLSMVYGVVRTHNGFIHVVSEKGRGSEFHLYLPISGKGAPCESIRTESPRSGQETILVVDDEEAIRSLTRDILENYGYRVMLAENGRQGLETYRRMRDNIHLVILDMVMPEMNGRATMKSLREYDPQVKILFTTGFAQGEEFREILHAGIDGFIPKPYQVQDLLGKVRQILDESPANVGTCQ